MNIVFFTVYFSKTPENIGKTDTVTVSDTVYKDTTITITKYKPVPKYIIKEKVDTLYDSNNNPVELVTENKLYQDTLICEKDTAELQIFTSGINAQVDSINLNLRKSETIVTNTVTITKYIEKKRTFLNRFNVGVQVGYGYGFKSKELEPYAGVGISFSF